MDAIAALVGPLEGDPDPKAPRTRVVGIETARVARYPNKGALYLLELRFVAGARPTIQDLRDLFGADRPIVPALHGERETLFYPPTRGTRWSVAVIAALGRCRDPHSAADPPPGPCEEIHAGARVHAIVFRRDPVTR